MGETLSREDIRRCAATPDHFAEDGAQWDGKEGRYVPQRALHPQLARVTGRRRDRERK